MDQGLDKKANIDLAGLICDLDAEKDVSVAGVAASCFEPNQCSFQT